MRKFKVDQGDHLFPTLLVSMMRVFLKHSLLSPLFIGEEDSPWPLFLSEFSFTFSPHADHWEQMAVLMSSLEGGQMASPFWLSH